MHSRAITTGSLARPNLTSTWTLENTQSLDPAEAGLALQNSPADSDRSQPAVSSHAAGFRSSYSQSQVRLRVDRCMHATAFGG
eukprot:COSAG01_NODE_6720_length_3524_cov_197.457859_2_plen_83_part_00